MEERILHKGEAAYENLEAAVSIMNDIAEKYGVDPKYHIGDTYLDLGADWRWTTIIYSEHPNSFQALYPRAWKEVVNGDFSGLEAIVVRQRDLLKNGKTW